MATNPRSPTDYVRPEVSPLEIEGRIKIISNLLHCSDPHYSGDQAVRLKNLCKSHLELAGKLATDSEVLRRINEAKRRIAQTYNETDFDDLTLQKPSQIVDAIMIQIKIAPEQSQSRVH